MSLRVSMLPVDKPVKDPIMSSPLRCEAVHIWLMSALSKAGPVDAHTLKAPQRPSKGVLSG